MEEYKVYDLCEEDFPEFNEGQENYVPSNDGTAKDYDIYISVSADNASGKAVVSFYVLHDGKCCRNYCKKGDVASGTQGLMYVKGVNSALETIGKYTNVRVHTSSEFLVNLINNRNAKKSEIKTEAQKIFNLLDKGKDILGVKEDKNELHIERLSEASKNTLDEYLAKNTPKE